MRWKHSRCSRSITSLIAFFFIAPLTFAADITGRVVDGANEPLMQASVRLLRPDSAFVKGTAADIDGRFRLADVKSGKYIVETTYVGFAPNYIDIQVGSEPVRLKRVVMSESSNLLKEVTVTGVRTPMKVMTDTIEFNAGSYMTRPNAVVEDLLKRLPGVEVDADGKITANGKEITKILVDGKEFFSDDPKVASKNLPADLVDKLQVVDRKSDLARLTGVDDGEDETVINLTVKKGMKNGWFGTAEAGYGTDSRYAASFNVSRFQGDNQFTLLGNFNNINQLGFTDGNGNRFRRFGGDNGITESQAVGINFNVGNNEILRVGGDVMYSHSNRNTRSHSERQYLFPDSTSYNSSWKRTDDRGDNVRGDFRVLWQPDSFNTLEFRPNFSVNLNNSWSVDSAFTRAGDPSMTLVNKTANDVNSRGNSFEFGSRLIYTHNFKQRRGRSFSIMANYRMSNVREKERSLSENLFYLFNDSTDIYDQFTNNHTWMNSIMSRASWTEPLGNPKNGNFLTLSYQMVYRWNNADKLVYDFLDNQMELNDTLSNRFRNNFFTQNIRFGYKRVSRSTNIEAGIALVPSRSSSTNLTNAAKSIPVRTVFNFAPFLRYNYKMTRTRSLQVNYRGRSSEPSMNQLQPVADLSDPLRIVQGNPDLDPSFTHHIDVRLQDFNSDAQRSMMVMANFDMIQNSIVSRTSYNSQTGGQYTTYENVNGVWNGRVFFMFSMPLRNKKWSLNNHLFTMFNRNVGFSNDLRNATFSVMLNESPSISFRPDNLELQLRPFYRLQTSTSTLPTIVGTTVHNYGFRLDGTYYFPFGLSLNTDLDFNASTGYSAGYDQRRWMWNAQVSYQFLSGKNATIAVKVYDILGQTQNISRNINASYIEDLDYSALTRYGMVTFTYRFNTFGKGNQPSDRGDFMHRGPGGPGGPGRPPRR